MVPQNERAWCAHTPQSIRRVCACVAVIASSLQAGRKWRSFPTGSGNRHTTYTRMKRWAQAPWVERRKVAVFACLGALTSCAVVESQVVPNRSEVPDGIPYFLPRRPFIVTVSLPVSGNLPILTITPGNAEPDLSQRFVLSQGTNLLANDEFNVTVGPNGLLMSSASTATSQVTTALQNAAASAGMFAGVPGAAANLGLARDQGNGPVITSTAVQPPSIACPPAGGSYQYAVYPEKQDNIHMPLTFCSEMPISFTVSWYRSDRTTGTYGVSNKNATPKKSWVSGLFFRHELPYVVAVKGVQTKTESDYIVTSPDESETDFFPVNRSFFANNSANITVTDGVLTGVDQTTTSELAALVGLPATFVSSYTTAVGQLFTGLTNNSSAQQKLLQQLQATAVTQNQASVVAAAQYQVCMKTVGKYNWGSLTPADAATALAAIKTACPGN